MNMFLLKHFPLTKLNKAVNTVENDFKQNFNLNDILIKFHLKTNNW